VLFVGAFALGVFGGAANVAINTQGTEVEAALGKPILSSFHGWFSLGSASGAIVGSAIIALGLQDGRGAAMVLVPLVLVSFVLAPFYLVASPRAKESSQVRRGGGPILAPAVLLIAGLCFFTNTAEGAVSDWSALYLSSVRQFPDAIAASGYIAFTLVMAASRFAGGPLVSRLGDQRVVLLGGVFIALGMAVVVFAPWAALSAVGFAVVAAGAANCYPVLTSASSRIPGVAASTGVATVATAGLLGFLIGPPLIGFVAHGFGLSAGIGLLIVFGVIVVAGTTLGRWPANSATSPA